ncbi:MAG: ABC transporter ATP-binding protein [Cyanobacteria bacterium TGS_CYA1]|nr:ABC transporter ATP-binding protein [Cyanobacteria bacterium TGS_CYA1]
MNQNSNGTAHVRVQNVSKKYKDHNVLALQNVNLDIQRGKLIALMGPSGCGKTTLLNCLGGLDVPDQGSITIGDSNLASMNENELTVLRRQKIGFVFQFFNLLPTLSVEENVALPLQLNGGMSAKEIDSRVIAVLEKLNIRERRTFYPAQLSGGEMQRTAVARAIVHKPQLILADEPTGNLDSANGVAVLNILQSLCRSENETIIMATHSPEAAEYADLVIHMKDGRLIESAP